MRPHRVTLMLYRRCYGHLWFSYEGYVKKLLPLFFSRILVTKMLQMNPETDIHLIIVSLMKNQIIETIFSPKSHKISIIFFRSSITSYVKNDKIYPLARRCQFSMFQPVDKHDSRPWIHHCTPPYNPDLPPPDYFLFPKVKNLITFWTPK